MGKTRKSAPKKSQITVEDIIAIAKADSKKALKKVIRNIGKKKTKKRTYNNIMKDFTKRK